MSALEKPAVRFAFHKVPPRKQYDGYIRAGAMLCLIAVVGLIPRVGTALSGALLLFQVIAVFRFFMKSNVHIKELTMDEDGFDVTYHQKGMALQSIDWKDARIHLKLNRFELEDRRRGILLGEAEIENMEFPDQWPQLVGLLKNCMVS